MIKAIVFDCFGVLTSDGWLPFKKKHFGHDPELNEEATSLNKQVDSGLIGYDEFIPAVAKLAGVPTEEAYKAIEGNVANEELLDYVATTLKPRYKLGILSNAGADWLNRLFGEEVSLFDAVALSYETGVVKPGERAYRIIAERLGVEPEECLFVDDQEKYCTAARESGMQAVWYRDFDQFKQDIEKVLGDLKN